MITNEERDLLIQQYYDRGILKKEIRSYEISLWTLQDEFMTVLKWSDVEQKGRIQDPQMTLNIDGTEKLTFSVPMYYNVNGQLIENPNWYIIQNKDVLIKGLRKLKVIFHKGEVNQKVFDFLITNVTESHDGDILMCNLEAEGLPFQELGKIGYKLNLSQENFELIYREWQENGSWHDRKMNQINTEPIANLNYWCEECAHLEPYPENAILNSRTWYYKVVMNYQSFTDSASRNNAKIYEEEHITAWNEETLVPTAVERYKEKARIISVENSNLYNITQTIAEQFGVFCRYEYVYNENFQIVGRIVIFYNNFSADNEAPIAFTYPHSAASTSRVTNSQDVVTKLYVSSVDNSSILAGTSTIINAPANKSQEDYILNFDYLKQIGAITKEQYSAISQYEKNIRKINLRLGKYQRRLATYQTKLPELEAQKTFYENAIDQDEEAIQQNTNLKNAITDGTGVITLTNANCDYCLIKTKKKTKKYITLSPSNKGVIAKTIKVYKSVDKDKKLKDKIKKKKCTYKYDKDHYVTAIYFDSTVTFDQTTTALYVTYSYSPQLYYDKIVKMWATKAKSDQKKLNKIINKLGPKQGETGYDTSTGLYKKIENMQNQIASEIANKNAKIEAFDHLMGPAIREGYWQPDDYSGYGEGRQYQSTLSTNFDSNTINSDSGQQAIIAFDANLFEEEDDLFYDCGITNADRVFYPCIDLSVVFPNGIPKDLDEYSIIWRASDMNLLYDDWTPGTAYQAGHGIIYESLAYKCITANSDTTFQKNRWAPFSWNWNQLNEDSDSEDAFGVEDVGVMGVGSSAIVKFLKLDNIVKPVLMLVGAENFTGDELYNLIEQGRPLLAKYQVSVDDNGINVSINNKHEIYYSGNNNVWLCYRISGSSSSNGWPSGDGVVPYSTVFKTVNNTTTYSLVYPRIKFSSLQLKITGDNFRIKYGNNLLSQFEDYYTGVRDTSRNSDYYTEYFITLKPSSLIKYGYNSNKLITVFYVLSNADTSIYLDALKVSKENAFPKVEYQITPQVLNTNLMSDIYNRLASIIMINDTELKFENVFGYISNIDLKLDAPWEDSIEVKNYTTKFEDLFSSIVASNEAMRQNENAISALADGTVSLPLSESGLSQTLLDPGALSILYNSLDEHFSNSEAIQNTLAGIFDEAGAILQNSSNTLNQVITLSAENAKILSGFAENISNNLAIHTYYGSERPKFFNNGDIWIRTYEDEDGNTQITRLVATSNSTDIYSEGESVTQGFTATYNGSLASIIGAKFSYDANAGTVNIYAKKMIDIGTAGDVAIGAHGDVFIVGNRSVNIGGSKINIVSDATSSNWENGISLKSIGPKLTDDSSVIMSLWTEIVGRRNLSLTIENDDEFKKAVDEHIVGPTQQGANNYVIEFKHFTDNSIIYQIYTDSTYKKDGSIIPLYSNGKFNYGEIYNTLLNLINEQSSVEILPTKISLTSSELELKAASKINLISSNEKHTAAMSISADSGIWIGSGRSVRLYSGAPGVTLYVGPVHASNVQQGDIWIKTTTGKEDNDNNSYYTNHILLADQYQDFWSEFEIEAVLQCTREGNNIENTNQDYFNSITSNFTESQRFQKARNYLIGNGANIELNNEHLLLGFSGGNNATAIKLNNKQVIITAGNISQLENQQITEIENISGVQIQSQYIGMATGSGTTRSIVSLSPTAIKIGNMTKIAGKNTDEPTSYEGNFIWLGKGEFYIGGNSNLTINTDNIQISYQQEKQESCFCLGANLLTKTPSKLLEFTANSTTQSLSLNVDGELTISSKGTLNILPGGQFKVFNKKTDNNITTTNSIALSGTSLVFTNLINNNNTSDDIGTRIILSDVLRVQVDRSSPGNAITDKWENVLVIDANGAVIPNGRLGNSMLFNQDGFEKEQNSKEVTAGKGATMGFKTLNGSGKIPFWIHMPPKTTNNNSDDIKIAFYYKNGKVYIRNLVLYNAIEYSSGPAFGETQPGSGANTGGNTTDNDSDQTPSTGGAISYVSNNKYTHTIYEGSTVIGVESHDLNASGVCTKCQVFIPPQ